MRMHMQTYKHTIQNHFSKVWCWCASYIKDLAKSQAYMSIAMKNERKPSFSS